MAEPATAVAGLWAAEEVVSTGVQAGAATYAVAKPTMPLKASFSRIAASTNDTSRTSLTRSHHSVSVVGKKAYIFGGQALGGSLTDNNISAVALSSDVSPDYQILPPLPAKEGGPVPKARTKHAACSLNQYIAVYGGCDEHGKLVDDDAKIWLFDTEKLAWEELEAALHVERAPRPRSESKLFAHDGNLVLYGGRDSNGEPMSDVWYFSCFTKTWNALPIASVSTSCAALFESTLYLISSSGDLSSTLHHLEIKIYDETSSVWESTNFPTNPLTPGPKPRTNAGLLPVTTGYGRNYLLYFMGDPMGQVEGAAPWSDLWTFQLPSSEPEMKASMNLSEGIKPAKIKDQIRAKLGADTGTGTWGEVEVLPPDDPESTGGWLHPGPRSCFGTDTVAHGRGLVVWGGVGIDGQPNGDGWLLKLE